VSVVQPDALVLVMHLAEQFAEHDVGVAGRIPAPADGLAPHDRRLQRHHHTELGQRAADAVDGKRAR
jgi:hypothetical protein